MFEASPRPDLRTMLLGAFIASLCAGALAGIVAILADATIDETAARILLTTGAITLYGLAALTASTLVGRRPDLAPLSLLTLATSAIGLVIALSAIWLDEPGVALIAALFLLASAVVPLIRLLGTKR